jgi:hypothetical protein
MKDETVCNKNIKQTTISRRRWRYLQNLLHDVLCFLVNIVIIHILNPNFTNNSIIL